MKNFQPQGEGRENQPVVGWNLPLFVGVDLRPRNDKVKKDFLVTALNGVSYALAWEYYVENVSTIITLLRESETERD